MSIGSGLLRAVADDHARGDRQLVGGETHRLDRGLVSTPAISNIMRPGLTTATQWSTAPLPEPIRISAGFLVTGLSGKMRIQTLPPR